jgi:hypothetical protein
MVHYKERIMGKDVVDIDKMVADQNPKQRFFTFLGYVVYALNILSMIYVVRDSYTVEYSALSTAAAFILFGALFVISISLIVPRYRTLSSTHQPQSLMLAMIIITMFAQTFLIGSGKSSINIWLLALSTLAGCFLGFVFDHHIYRRKFYKAFDKD